MSRSLTRLNLSTRSIQSVPSGSVLAPPRTLSAFRRRRLHVSTTSLPCRNSVIEQASFHTTRPIHTTVKQDDPPSDRDPSPDTLSHIAESSPSDVPESLELDSNVGAGHQEEEMLDSRFSRHLDEQFSPLKFPPELAKRILTHGSHKKAPMDGHNARLAFVGRRVLQAYLTLFLHSSPASDITHDYELIAARTLNTYGLGQYVAPKWHLGRVLRWQPTIGPRANFNFDIKSRPGRSGNDVDPELTAALKAYPQVVRSVGLYKVMGEAVQAVVGGTYHQFGGSVAHRMFHTRILPHLLKHGPLGLHEAYHVDAFNKDKMLRTIGLVPPRKEG